MAECPKCGEPYDEKLDQLVTCPTCKSEGSTACCNVAGVGVECVECEEGDE